MKIDSHPSASSACSAVLQYFDQISEAPDSIQRLRRFILDLAVRGKLVEQNPNDEPAAELLKRIEEEKYRIQKASQSKKENFFGTIKEDEIPFSVPPSWGWARLGNITTYIQRGKLPQYSTGYGPSVISQKCIQRDGLHMEWAKFLVPESLENYEPVRFLQDGDLLWNSTGTGTIGRVIRVDHPSEPLVCDSHVTVIRCLFVDERFICIWLRADYVYGTIEDRATGATKQVELTASMANSQITPLPPLAEQHRIVAKVDELMKLCDELEAAQQKRESRRDRLITAALNKLTDETENKSILKFSISSACSAVSRPTHIHQLRQTILNLAVRGKIVSQNSMDESASDLLELIAQEQRLLIENGHLKRRMHLDDSKVFRGPHSIPKHWLWVPLAKLITFGPQNGVSPKPTNDVKAPKALTLTATTSGYFNSTHYKHIELNEAACEHYWLSPGDVLFQRGNTREYVGIAAAFDGPEQSFIFPDLMIRVRFSKSLDLRYIHTALISPPLRRYFSERASGASSSMPKISQGVLLNAPIPLPPLSEQHRILERIDILMALCAGLEASLTTTATTRLQLLNATLAEIFSERSELQKVTI